MDETKLNQILVNQIAIMTMLASICKKNIDVDNEVKILSDFSRKLVADHLDREINI